MLSWRKTRVVLHGSHFCLNALFRRVLVVDPIEVIGTQSHASLASITVLSKLPTSTRFDRTEPFSTIPRSILLQARDPAKLNEAIQTAIDEHDCNEAWRLFEQHMQIEGFPRKSVVNNLLICFASSLDSNWLQKGFSLVEQAFEERKQNLLEKEPLLYLSLALAKSGLVVSTSTVLRKLIEIEEYPNVSVWSAVLAYLFQNNRIDPRKKSNAVLLAMKPNTMALNIALTGCLLFGTTRKAEELLNMIPKIGVKADANMLVTMHGEKS